MLPKEGWSLSTMGYLSWGVTQPDLSADRSAWQPEEGGWEAEGCWKNCPNQHEAGSLQE